MTKALQEMVNECLDSRAGRRLQVSFPPVLEKRFKDDRRNEKIRETILAGCIASLFYDLMLISDYAKGPQAFWRGILLRLCVFTPFVLASIWIAHRWRVEPVREIAFAAAGSLAGACTLMIGFGCSAPVSALSELGLLAVIATGSVTLGLSLPYAAAMNAILLCSDVVFFAYDRWLTNAEKMACASMMGACTVLLVISVYRGEAMERTAYLLFLREELRVESLADLNQNLTEISSQDGLTGLSNRRCFDEYLHWAWERAREETAPISIIMADLDHFKAVNDNFGHPFGDQVLVAVAEILRANFRSGEDMVARFGGEEFIVVLPHLDLDAARQAAERLCSQVRKMELVAPNDGSLLHITVSLGVSSGHVSSLTTPSELISLADQALYRAKHSGRNQVCWAANSSKTAALTL